MPGFSSSAADVRESVALSFDVECYYQIIAKDYFGMLIPPTDEVLRNTSWILDLLERERARATFFFLGNVAEKYPELVRRAFEDGHEIGVHGDQHHYISEMGPVEFKREIETAISKICVAGAANVVGHRATAFSINKHNLWALDTLRDLGLQYDSSIFPFAGRRYGIADWPRRPGPTESGISEVPMSVVNLAGRQIPCMGGGYVRYFPIAFTRWCASKLHREGLTPVSYFHPYEFELRPPTFGETEFGNLDAATAKRLKRFNRLQAVGRGNSMRHKLEWLLENYRTVPVGSLAS